jgi:hypothetical protein
VVPVLGQGFGGVWGLAKWIIFRAPGTGTELVDFVLDCNHGLNESIYLWLWL